MAIPVGAVLEITTRGLVFQNAVYNVWQYEVTTSAPTITAEQAAQAWWNNVKANYRAVPTSTYTGLFGSIACREISDPSGAYGVYGVPVGEQSGTRSPGSSSDILPMFNAAAVRLNVGTRVTRPGQKRFCGLNEDDQTSGVLQTAVKNALNTLMTQMIASMTLGAPAATMTLKPVVCTKDVTGMPTVWQPITSFTVNEYVSSQVSRKVGRGA